MKKHHLTRLCSILLLAALLVSLTVPLASAYSDVTRSAFPDYFDAINYVTDNGLMNGTSSTQFEPNSFVSRAMVVTTLYRMAGSPSSSASVSFTDVSSTDWFYKAVRWSVQYGIANGVTTTTFEPNSMVTREQALTFFLRYLKNFEKRTAYYHYSITYCGDYSQIDSYAVASFRWAVSNGIVYPDSSANNKLYPKSYVYRRELALWLCRYGTNIWGIRHGKDSFRFVNNVENFVSGTRTYPKLLISSKHYNKLLSLTTTDTERASLANEKLYGQTGVCYGMTMSMLMDKLGKINLDGAFVNNCDNLWDIPVPKNINSPLHKKVLDQTDNSYVSLVESAINFYYLSQRITSRFNPRTGGGLWIWPYSGQSGRLNWEDVLGYTRQDTVGLDKVVEFQRKSQLTLIGLHYSGPIYTEEYGDDLVGYAHSILIYGAPTLQSGYYAFNAYDPNTLSQAKLKIKTDYSKCYLESPSLTEPLEVEALEYFKNYYYFNCLDLDGDSNTTPYSMPLEQIEESSNEYAYLYVDLVGTNTITNAEGESLKIGPYGIDGDIDVFNINYISNGDKFPETLVLKVRNSQSFELNSESAYVRFEVVGTDIFASVHGTGIKTVFANNTGVTIEGVNMDYRVSSSCGCPNDLFLSIAGLQENKFELQGTDEVINIMTTYESGVDFVSSINSSINLGVEKKSGTILCITGLSSDTPNLVEQGNTLSG